MNRWLKIALCILLPVAVGGISGYVTFQNVATWYPTLQKPSFNPPNAVFGPVWTVLYILMGISLYLLLLTPPSAARKKAVVLFGAQLFLNFWWSILFFYFHWIGIALVEIILLWLLILLMILQFLKVSKPAAHLQWPYLAWVSFATVLNGSIWLLN